MERHSIIMRFSSLNQFYTSDIWRNLRLQLMSERTKDGVLYDEYNGEPIIKSFDVIAHHKQEITLQNVNDFSISLNPDNIMLVSHRSHNEIHSRFGHLANKKIYYVYGPPCAGKSSFVHAVKGNSDLIIDIDLIWQCVTGGNPYDKPDALKTVVFAVRDTMLEKAKTRAGRWERCYIIEGGANKTERQRKIESIGCEPIFIQATRAECINNLMNDEQRANVRDLWQNYIDEWFDKYTE